MSFPRGPADSAAHPRTPQGGGYYVHSTGGFHWSPRPGDSTRYTSPAGIGGSLHLPPAPLPSADLRGMSGAEPPGALTWPHVRRGVPVVLRPSRPSAAEGRDTREPRQHDQLRQRQGPTGVEKDKVLRPAWRVLDADGDPIDTLPAGVDWEAEGRLVVGGVREPPLVKDARMAVVAASRLHFGEGSAAAWYNAAADFAVARAKLDAARASESFPREELSRLEAEVERAKAAAKIAELEVDGRDKNRAEIEQLRRTVAADKDAAAERERRLAAEAQAVARAPSSAAPLASSSSTTPRPRAWLVEATVTGRTGQPRRRVHVLAQRCGGYYAVARREDEGHRGDSIFWVERDPSEGSSTAASLEYGSTSDESPQEIAARHAEKYTLFVRVVFGEAKSANEFRRLLQVWPTEGDASIATEVALPQPLEDAFEELLTHEIVEEGHYVHGTDTNTPPTTPPKDEGGLDRTLSHRTEQTLCKPRSPLGMFQGLDVKRGFRHNDSGEAAHLIDKAVVASLGPAHPYREYGFLTLDDDHPTSSCNFVGASAPLHKLIDGRDGNREGTPVALRYVSHEPTPRTVGGGVQELDAHVRYEVHVDVVFRDNDRNAYLEDCTFVFDHVVDKDVTVNIGGNRQAVRVCLLVRNPAVFKYCVDWKFVKTAREWCAEGTGADVATVFGVDVGVYPDKVINPQFTEAYLYNSVATRAMTVLAEANNE